MKQNGNFRLTLVFGLPTRFAGAAILAEIDPANDL